MAAITLMKSKKVVQVPEGSNLMSSLLDAGVPVASSCGGDGVCAKCHLKILEGKEHLSKETQEEQELKEINDISKGERISCQTSVLGDVTVDAPYW
jgi:2Fe-2S ferredoxin